MSVASMIVRHMFGEGDKKRDAGLETPKSVKRFDNISYGPNKKYQVLDVYRPEEAKGDLPVIVIVHGGAWVYGDKEVYQYYGMSLAERGFAVVNFSYRLAPAYRYPAGIEDTNTVFNWILENAPMYGLDTKNLFAVGDSAGGQMLAIYCNILTNPEYAKTFDFVPAQVKLNAVALNCGKYDMTGRIPCDAEKMFKPLMKDIFVNKGTDEERNWATPLNSVTADFPPAFVMTALGDFLKADAPEMVDKFVELGVEHAYVVYGTEEEPLEHVFHCNMKRPEAHVCNDDECAFFKKYIR